MRFRRTPPKSQEEASESSAVALPRDRATYRAEFLGLGQTFKSLDRILKENV